MKCPKCKKDLVFGAHVDYDEISITEVDDERIDIELECNEDNDGCGYKGFWVLGMDGILEV
jgi:hypothetical protein